jgi:hypothetical protein
MINSKLIELLEEFPDDMEVEICDGYNCITYGGDFEIIEFDNNGHKFISIGVGDLDR